MPDASHPVTLRGNCAPLPPRPGTLQFHNLLLLDVDQLATVRSPCRLRTSGERLFFRHGPRLLRHLPAGGVDFSDEDIIAGDRQRRI